MGGQGGKVKRSNSGEGGLDYLQVVIECLFDFREMEVDGQVQVADRGRHLSYVLEDHLIRVIGQREGDRGKGEAT